MLLDPIASNGSNAYNVTLLLPWGKLPADPALYIVPGSTQSILFSHYSKPLRQSDVLICLLEAANLVNKELSNDNYGSIADEEIQTNSGTVHLFFHPSDRMTWRMVS